MKLPSKYVKEMIDWGRGYNEETDKYLHYVDQIFTHESRWDLHFNIIFSYDHTTYRLNYYRGKTESQDYDMFDNVDSVECVEVEPVQKTITVYEDVIGLDN